MNLDLLRPTIEAAIDAARLHAADRPKRAFLHIHFTPGTLRAEVTSSEAVSDRAPPQGPFSGSLCRELHPGLPAGKQCEVDLLTVWALELLALTRPALMQQVTSRAELTPRHLHALRMRLPANDPRAFTLEKLAMSSLSMDAHRHQRSLSAKALPMINLDSLRTQIFQALRQHAAAPSEPLWLHTTVNPDTGAMEVTPCAGQYCVVPNGAALLSVKLPSGAKDEAVAGEIAVIATLDALMEACPATIPSVLLRPEMSEAWIWSLWRRMDAAGAKDTAAARFLYSRGDGSPNGNADTVQAAQDALDTHSDRMTVDAEGDPSLALWHMLLALDEWAAVQGVSLDAELQNMRQSLATDELKAPAAKARLLSGQEHIHQRQRG